MKPKVLIVANDAGGAEILSAWCFENEKKYDLLYCLTGPALKIFQINGNDIKLCPLKIIENFNKNDLVITGTSLEANLEREAILFAKRNTIKSITFLDHWDLYCERFGSKYTWKNNLPDEIRVVDKYAFDYACDQKFPLNKLKLVENPYLEKIKRIYASRKVGYSKDEKLLFICEPISRKIKAAFPFDYLKYDSEIDNFQKFLSAAYEGHNKYKSITIRLHPSEKNDKYNHLMNKFSNLDFISFSTEQILVNDILTHSIIVGMESNALAISVSLNKRTISCITGKQWRISLPHHQIEKITNYEKLFLE